MTLSKLNSFELSSLTAAAYQSAVANQVFAFDRDDAQQAGFLSIGAVSNSAQLFATFYTGLESSVAANAAWNEVLKTNTLSSTDSRAVVASPVANQASLLPYGRIKLELRNAGATQATISTIKAILATK